MKLIAHRGNISGPNPLEENNPQYIDKAIGLGFDVEIDLRWDDQYFYLGHDDPQYYVPMSWLVKRKDKLWIHCKNLKSLDVISSSPVDLHYFWHETDQYTLTNRGIGWVYPGIQPYKKSVVVMPELHPEKTEYIKNVYGICTDYPEKLE